jgi:hypothetical protein
LETQGKLVLALAVLHNIIIDNHGQSDYFADPNYIGDAPQEDEIPDEEEDDQVSLSQAQQQAAHKLWRDSLAKEMWEQYSSYLRQRGS